MINEEISKEAGQAAQTIISYTIKAAKESINLEKEIKKFINIRCIKQRKILIWVDYNFPFLFMFVPTNGWTYEWHDYRRKINDDYKCKGVITEETFDKF